MNQSELYARLKALPPDLFQRISHELGISPEIRGQVAARAQRQQADLKQALEEAYDQAFESVKLEPWRLKTLEEFLDRHARAAATAPAQAPAASAPPSAGQQAQEREQQIRAAYKQSYSEGSMK